MIEDLLEELALQYEETCERLASGLSKIRTGRANLAMLDSVRIDYYGQSSPLNQVATMKVADPRLITIQPWEKNLVNEIERSIAAAGLGLNPSSDGIVIRVPIPALTGERRQELVKQAKKIGEEHKISLRNQRRDANETVKNMEKNSDITEDEMHRTFEKINALTEKYTKKIEQAVEKKEADIVEV